MQGCVSRRESRSTSAELKHTETIQQYSSCPAAIVDWRCAETSDQQANMCCRLPLDIRVYESMRRGIATKQHPLACRCLILAPDRIKSLLLGNRGDIAVTVAYSGHILIHATEVMQSDVSESSSSHRQMQYTYAIYI